MPLEHLNRLSGRHQRKEQIFSEMYLSIFEAEGGGAFCSGTCCWSIRCDLISLNERSPPPTCERVCWKLMLECSLMSTYLPAVEVKFCCSCRAHHLTVSLTLVDTTAHTSCFHTHKTLNTLPRAKVHTLRMHMPQALPLTVHIHHHYLLTPT